MPYCWKCQAPYAKLTKKPDFHDLCDECKNYWHSCSNCRFFTGYPSARCTLPNTDAVHDLVGANFCDEFVLNEGERKKAADKKDPHAARKRWDELFRS